jgi:uncharacterized protein (TIGR02145 family)
MRKLLLTAAAVAAAIGLAGCSKTLIREPVSETLTVAKTMTREPVSETLTQTAAETDTVAGMITDTRDGQTYKTVKIGNQTWMAQNLNYQTPDSSWCYSEDSVYCNKYGRLYAWNAAKMACFAGYHLPSREEWDSLAQAVRGTKRSDEYGDNAWYDASKKLKAKSGWRNSGWHNVGNGTDEFGFSALPGGYRNYYDGAFDGAGYRGNWWTATEYSNDHAYRRDMSYHHDYVYEDYYDKDYGYSVRCVADSP